MFVYGSLTGPAASLPGARLTELAGFARGWGVAMDNRVDLPGYKYYAAPDGERPAVHVAFIDVSADEAASTIGVVRPVDERDLVYLDDRERNYRRIRVDDRVDGVDGDPVWTYVGTAAGRARFAEGPTVIQAGYLRAVLDAFARFGPAIHARVREELAPGRLSVCELVRHDLPPAPAIDRGRAAAV